MRVAIGLSLALALAFGASVGLGTESPGKEPAKSETRGTKALKSAAKSNKYLFIFFYQDPDDMQTRKMYDVLQKAVEKMKDRADCVGISIVDREEKPVVDQFRARGAPMPIALAVAPTGAPTKAFPKEFDYAKLQEAFVSKCAAKCMKSIWDRHSILLCVQNHKTKENKEALDGAKEFKNDPKYAKGIDIIMLDPADKAEHAFLKDLEVDPRTETAVTVLVMPPGAPVARFTGALTKNQIETAVEKAKANCGPGCDCH
jgi:hypothetical protein